MSGRLAAWLARSQFGVSVMAGVAGVLLLQQSGHTPHVAADVGQNPFDIAYSLAFSGVGALIASQRPGNPVGWLLCFIGCTASLGMGGFGYGYAYDSVEGPVGPLPGAAWVAWSSVVTQSVGPFLGSVAFILFPTGRPASERWRTMAWLTLGLGVLSGLLAATQPESLLSFPEIQNPLGIPGDSPFAGAAASLSGWADALQPIALVIGAAALLTRFRHARGQQRQQLKWVVYALTIVPAYFALLIAGTFLTFMSAPDWLGAIVGGGWAIWPLFVAALPVSVGVAILRYRLFDIDLIIRRTLIYGVMTAVLAAVYWASVALLQQALRPLTAGSDLAIVGSTLAVATLFQPLRRRIQHTVDVRFYRQRYNASRTLESFSSRLRDEVDLESLGAELLAVVEQTMQPQRLSLWLRQVDRKP
jgi:hypothetical protein